MRILNSETIIRVALVGIFLILLVDLYSNTIHPFVYLKLRTDELTSLFQDCMVAKSSLADFSQIAVGENGVLAREIAQSNYVALLVCDDYDLTVVELRANNVDEYKIRLAEQTGSIDG